MGIAVVVGVDPSKGDVGLSKGDVFVLGESEVVGVEAVGKLHHAALSDDIWAEAFLVVVDDICEDFLEILLNEVAFVGFFVGGFLPGGEISGEDSTGASDNDDDNKADEGKDD